MKASARRGRAGGRAASRSRRRRAVGRQHRSVRGEVAQQDGRTTGRRVRTRPDPDACSGRRVFGEGEREARRAGAVSSSRRARAAWLELRVAGIVAATRALRDVAAARAERVRFPSIARSRGALDRLSLLLVAGSCSRAARRLHRGLARWPRARDPEPVPALGWRCRPAHPAARRRSTRRCASCAKRSASPRRPESRRFARDIDAPSSGARVCSFFELGLDAPIERRVDRREVVWAGSGDAGRGAAAGLRRPCAPISKRAWAIGAARRAAQAPSPPRGTSPPEIGGRFRIARGKRSTSHSTTLRPTPRTPRFWRSTTARGGSRRCSPGRAPMPRSLRRAGIGVAVITPPAVAASDSGRDR